MLDSIDEVSPWQEKGTPKLQSTRVAANPFADAESPSFVGSSLISRSEDQAVLGILQEPD